MRTTKQQPNNNCGKGSLRAKPATCFSKQHFHSDNGSYSK